MKPKDLFFIGTLLIILLLISLSTAILNNNEADYHSIGGSTYGAYPNGTKAFYLFLKEMGIEAKRWQIPLEILKTDKETGQMMIVIDTDAQFYGDQNNELNFDGLFDWVNKGNTLLLIGDSPYLNSNKLKGELLGYTYSHFGNDRIYEKNLVSVTPSFPTKYCWGVNKIKLSSSLRLKLNRDDKVVHFQDQKGDIVISISEGKGKIILISDPFIVYNQGIDKEGNITFLTNIIFSETPSKKIYFDEFDHGYSTEKGLLNYFKGAPLSLISIPLLLAGSIYVYSHNRRFGNPKIIKPRQRRSIIEYVTSMSTILEKTESYGLGISWIYKRYKTIWIKSLGAASQLTLEEFSKIIAAKTNRNEAAIKEILFKCEKGAEGEVISKNEALFLAEKLEQIRKELNNAGN